MNNLGFDYINNSTYYNIDDVGNNNSEFNALVQINNRQDAINIYIVNNAVSYDGRANGILSQALVIESSWVNTQMVSHEVGHCLDLWHTFQGTAANTSGCAEAINGSNCTTCGDYVCDTPADANTGNSGGYTPDMDNIMSYYYPFDHFSDGQIARSRYAFASSPILQQVIGTTCLIPKISGPVNICNSLGTTFTLNPTSNTTPTWNVSSNLIILSQSQNSITVKPTSSSTNGAGYIEATFQTQTIKKDIWIGKPRITSAKLDDGQYLSYGSFPNQVCKLKQINTDITLGGADSASWSLVNSSQTVSWSQQGNNLSLYLWNINQTATFRITLNNECGTFTRDFTFTAKDCSGDGNDPCDVTYLISPNPTSTNIEITPNIPAPCDSLITALGQKTQYTIATLYDFNGNPVLAKSPAAGTMNVKDLSPGYYILVISTNGKKESHTIVIR